MINNETFRMGLIFLHVIALALALGAVLREDFKLLGKNGMNLAALDETHGVVSLGLVLLWISGACIAWLDTGGSVQELLARPKLLAKLTVVLVLTANGLLIERIGMPWLRRAHRRPWVAAAPLAVVGAISTTSWLFAAVLGVGRPLVALLGLTGTLLLYAGLLAAASVVALVFAAPRVARWLQQEVRTDASVGMPIYEGRHSH